MLDVLQVDPHDEVGLRAWWDTNHAAILADRPEAALLTWPELRHLVAGGSTYYSWQLLVAREQGRCVGTAIVGLAHRDNTHLADLEVAVLPASRRRGIGTALAEEGLRRVLDAGRTTVIGEAYLTAASEAPVAFARSLGFEPVHEELHLLMPLPVPADELAELRAQVGALAGDYDVLTWVDRCPEEYVDAYCRMRTQMSADVPVGDLDLTPVAYDEERLRADEALDLPVSDQVVAVARHRETGAFGGYSVVKLAHGDDLVRQDDTLVMPRHRGRRLGLRLKLATLEEVQRRFPERATLHTWTAPDNRAMLRTNITFGFEQVAQMFEMQRRLGPTG
ncbi:MAG: GNAT family N-acetyltransferase [Nocardioidaceae bacterium]